MSIILTQLIASGQATLTELPSNVYDNSLGLFVLVLSAFLGGFFAAYWSNHFEIKRRIHDKRHDKYYEHRNTIVQLEQELIPLRVNIDRNNASISDAIDNTNSINIRFILRFYKLHLSTGLGMKLLNLDIINKYAKLYSAIETFNSNIEYVSGMITTVKEDAKVGRKDDSIVESYKLYLPQLKDLCEQIDSRSLELLCLCKLALHQDEKKAREKYKDDGGEVKYTFSKEAINRTQTKIKKEEDGSQHKNEKQPQFISPFLDLKKILVKVTKQ